MSPDELPSPHEPDNSAEREAQVNRAFFDATVRFVELEYDLMERFFGLDFLTGLADKSADQPGEQFAQDPDLMAAESMRGQLHLVAYEAAGGRQVQSFNIMLIKPGQVHLYRMEKAPGSAAPHVQSVVMAAGEDRLLAITKQAKKTGHTPGEPAIAEISPQTVIDKIHQVNQFYESLAELDGTQLRQCLGQPLED